MQRNIPFSILLNVLLGIPLSISLSIPLYIPLSIPTHYLTQRPARKYLPPKGNLCYISVTRE